MNDYADVSTDTIDGAGSLGVTNQLFARAVGTQMDGILTETQIVNLKHATSSTDTPSTASQVSQIDIWFILIRAIVPI